MTSRWNPTASPPSALILPTMSSSFSTRRAPSATGKPRAASSMAVASPMPDGGAGDDGGPAVGKRGETWHLADLHGDR